MNSRDSETPQFKVKKLFGEKSKDYATSSLLVDKRNLEMVIKMARITEGERILDVATGTGFMAGALAGAGAEVVATDFTREMLVEARSSLEERSNVYYALADADNLPFAGESFDAVTCRVSVHHFVNPYKAVAEMTRVCGDGGRVVIMDVISSEDDAKSELQNRMGKMRDPSEVRQWKLSELERMLTSAGMKIEQVERWAHIMAFEEWIRLGGTDESTAIELRQLMMDSINMDRTGFSPELREGELYFTWTTGIIVAGKRG
ncbi:MAG: methyltransferase domain-containing protein [Dehalococcoidia bacterium]